jgi:hypothetical protein
LPQRIDAHWKAWASAFPAGAGALDPQRPEPVAAPPDRIEAHEDAPGDRAAERKGPKKGPKPLLTPSSTALESEKAVALKRRIAGGSPGARTPNLRIKSLPDHTSGNRLSSDCNGFRLTQTLPEPPRPVKKGPPPRG